MPIFIFLTLLFLSENVLVTSYLLPPCFLLCGIVTESFRFKDVIWLLLITSFEITDFFLFVRVLPVLGLFSVMLDINRFFFNYFEIWLLL